MRKIRRTAGLDIIKEQWNALSRAQLHKPLLIMGAVLALIALFCPWFTFKLHVEGGYILCQISPLMMEVKQYIELGSEVSSRLVLFYEFNLGAILVILAYIVGLFIYVTGGLRQRKIGNAGVLMVFVSSILFPSCLPGRYGIFRVSWGLGIAFVANLLLGTYLVFEK